MKHYDVLIIGGGPGGYVCAIRSAQLGLKTALVEKEALGGTCLNWGCIPTKALLRSAEVLSSIRGSRVHGIDIAGDHIRVDYRIAWKRSRQISERLSKGVSSLMKKNGVDVYMDEAAIRSKDRVELITEGAFLGCSHMVLATGADAISLPGVVPDGKQVLLPRHALSLEHLPESMGIIGAGAIGMEFATLWSAFGSKVTVFEGLDRLLPKEDPTVGSLMAKRFSQKGIGYTTGCKVLGIVKGDKGVDIRIQQRDGAEKTVSRELVLLALGVRPRSRASGIEALGIALNGTAIEVNEKMETSIQGVYAIGDLNGKFPLAHVASEQGIIAAEVIAGFDTKPINYKNIPRCTYTDPEIASIGFTTSEATEGGLDVVADTFPLAANGKSLTLDEGEGFITLVTEKSTGALLGAHMVGPHVTEMVGGLSLAISLETTADEVAAAVFPHPTVSEAIMEAALRVEKRPIHF